MPKKIDWEAKRMAWERAVAGLCDEVEGWARQQGWDVARQTKSLQEEYLGSYTLPFLSIGSPEVTIHVDPVGRNIIGAEGRVDILSFPSLNRMLLIRLGDRWRLKTDARIDWPNPWNKETFFELVHALASAA